MRRFGFHQLGRGRALGLVALTGSVVSLAVLGVLPVEAGTAATAAKARAPGTGAPLLFPAGVGSSNTAASAQGTSCLGVQGFKSLANGRYVAAELDYGPFKYPRQNLYGMLRARATTEGAWEKFNFCYDNKTGVWWINSHANHKLVSTEMNYNGRNGKDKYMLRARADSIGPWEEYRVECIKDEPEVFAIKSVASDRYVAAELNFTGDDYGMLRARSDTVGAWEKFFPLSACK